MYCHSLIFKTNINIFIVFISNNRSFHTTIHHPNFTKTGSFYVWIGDSTFFKFAIIFMFCHSSIFKTNINIFVCIISNNCRFYSTVHHSDFAKSIYSCCHKLSLAFYICSYLLYMSKYLKCLFVLPMLYFFMLYHFLRS